MIKALEQDGQLLPNRFLHHVASLLGTRLHRRPPSTSNLRRRACALVLVAAALTLGSCDDKQDDDSQILSIPSPAGSGVVIKNYSRRSGSYIMKLLIKPQGKDAHVTTIVTEAPRDSRGGHEDGVVVGWDDEGRVIIGWPVGDAIPPRLPDDPGDVDINYVNYEPDLAKTTPFLLEQVTLRDVRYAAEPRLDGPRGNCVIKVRGTDGRFFDAVEFNLVRLVYNLSRAGEREYVLRPDNHLPQLNSTLEFVLAPLPKGRPLKLTPTQAKLGDIEPYVANTDDHRIIVSQTSTTLKYERLGARNHAEILRTLREGNYPVRFNLTFGLRRIEYLVREPISAEVLADHDKCVAQR